MERERMKVLAIIDQYNWAFDFCARGIQKYSRHFIDIIRYNEMIYKQEDIEAGRYDCLFFLNRSCYDALPESVRRMVDQFQNKCVGIRGGFPPWSCDLPILNWKVGCVSKYTYNKLLEKKQPRLFYCPNGVDTETFKPVKRPLTRFVVGWAGNPSQQAKRVWMLEKLSYPVLKQGNWGDFIKNKPRDEMVNFYSKIDAYVCTSDFEGMPQTILESAATGLPIVSTAVGGVPDVIDEKWLVPIYPEEQVIKEINEKLTMLHKNASLRKSVGLDNLSRIQDKWGWNLIVKSYDTMFESDWVKESTTQKSLQHEKTRLEIDGARPFKYMCFCGWGSDNEKDLKGHKEAEHGIT